MHRVRYKVRLKMDGGWLQDTSKWLTSAVKTAFRDLDYDRFARTSYAKTSFSGAMRDAGNTVDDTATVTSTAAAE